MIKALGHHVLVKVGIPEEKTAGGIILPGTVRDMELRGSEIGTVVDVGPTAYKAEGLGGEPWCKTGDLIYFAKYAGKWVKEPGKDEEFLMLNDDDVVGVIVEDK
jgi:Co-chaperonin GroES (HSP10)